MNLLSHSQARQLMRRHFALLNSVESEHSMRQHLQDCRECAAWYERHLLLASLDPQAASAEQRLAAGLGLRSPARSRVFSLQAGLAAAVVAVCALLLFMQRPAELGARGGEPPRSQVLVYRVTPNHPPTALGASMHKSDELAFAYVNPMGFKRLLIFGVDEHGHVFWYHPGWSNASENPRAIAIASGPELRELPEAVTHELDGKSLKIHALFTNADLTVRDVEAMLQRRSLAPDTSRGAPAPNDALETEIDLAVE